MTGGSGDGLSPQPERLAGRFRLRRLVAHGGMGSVYEAEDEALGRTVAIKLLRTGGDDATVARFQAEARAVGALNHPGIVTLFDHGVDDGRHYLVMELVHGPDLAGLLREQGRLPAAQALDIVAHVAAALHHAHVAGIVHRDVKPANILLERDGRVRLTDFGIARMADAAAMTATGTMIGTARYCAPEQAAGEHVGPAADVYATGVVLYELLTGRPPFDGDNPGVIAARRLTEPVPPPSRARPDLPAAVDDVVLRATARDPRDRYPSAAAFADALRAAASDVPATGTARLPTVVDEPAGPDRVDGRQPLPAWWQRRSRAQRRLVAGVVSGIVLVGVALAVNAAGGEDPAPPADETPAEQTPADDTVFEITDAVIGLDGQKVAERLEEAGFVVEMRPTDADQPPGTVVDIEPGVGSHVRAGDTIILQVAAS